MFRVTSLFPLYPVQCKFIPNYSGGGNVNSHIVHFDICICLNIFFMADGGIGGRGSFRRGNEPDFDSRFGG